MMAAITPMSTRGLVRFDDTLMGWANRDTNGTKGVSGVSGLGAPNPSYDPSRVDAGGLTIYQDLDTGAEYVLDDNGNPAWVADIASQSSAPGGSTTQVQIPGQTTGQTPSGTIRFNLPGGVPVTTTVGRPVTAPTSASRQWIAGVPNQYLLIGGVFIIATMILSKR